MDAETWLEEGQIWDEGGDTDQIIIFGLIHLVIKKYQTCFYVRLKNLTRTNHNTAHHKFYYHNFKAKNTGLMK